MNVQSGNLCNTESIAETCTHKAQNCFFSAATGNALTTVFAGLAFTMTTLPKTSLFPALVAGFLRVLILQMPGKVKTALFFSSPAPISARLARTLETSFFLSSHPVARASAKALLPMTAPFIALGGMLGKWRGRTYTSTTKWGTAADLNQNG